MNPSMTEGGPESGKVTQHEEKRQHLAFDQTLGKEGGGQAWRAGTKPAYGTMGLFACTALPQDQAHVVALLQKNQLFWPNAGYRLRWRRRLTYMQPANLSQACLNRISIAAAQLTT